MKTTKLPVHVQLISFIKKYADKINREPWTTFEFEIKGGKLTGMRTKEYIKAGLDDGDST